MNLIIQKENPKVTIIKPRTYRLSVDFYELLRYKELLFFLVWRDIKVKYKHTLLGIGWSILQPFLTMVVFSFIFGHLAKIPSEGVPYPIFSYTALLPWIFFSNSISQSANSLITNANLIQKVYFPRTIIPLSCIFSNLIDFLFAFIILIGLIIIFNIKLKISILYLLLLIPLLIITSFGIGLWLSAMNVSYRDIKYVIPFLLQLWMFITPIVYPTSILSKNLHFIYSLNPMTGIIEGFRHALLGTNIPSLTILITSTITAFTLLVSGIIYFRHMEKTFADII